MVKKVRKEEEKAISDDESSISEDVQDQSDISDAEEGED